MSVIGRASTELIKAGGHPVEGPTGDTEFIVELDLEGGSKHDAAKLIDVLTERRDVAMMGLGTAGGERLVQERACFSPGFETLVLAFDMLKLCLCLIELLGQPLLPLQVEHHPKIPAALLVLTELSRASRLRCACIPQQRVEAVGVFGGEVGFGVAVDQLGAKRGDRVFGRARLRLRGLQIWSKG